MKKTMAVLVFGLASLGASGGTLAQNRAWNDCIHRAAVASGVSESAIEVAVENDGARGDRYILSWIVRGNDWRRQRGYCEIDRRAKNVVRFETTPYNSDDQDRDRDWEPFQGEYPHVRVDTDGKGYFSSRVLRSDRLDRGYVDTKDQVSVSLRGRDGFRVTFYGTVIASDGNREITLRITSSDRGQARGRASLRLNHDRNEVEWISLKGRMIDGEEFSAEFNRNR